MKLLQVLCLFLVISCGGTGKPADSVTVEREECTAEYAAKVAVACNLRVQTECVDRQIPKEDCVPLKECKATSDQRYKECHR